MKMKNIAILISVLLLTACAGTTPPNGPRVRPMDGGISFPEEAPSVSYGYGANNGPKVQNENDFLATTQASTAEPTFSAAPPVYHQSPDRESTWNPAPTPVTTAPAQQPQAAYNPAPVQQPAPAIKPKTEDSTPIRALLNEANAAVNNNDLTKAASLLNRAVRIEPTNESIWFDLAQISLHQKEYAKAEQLASKSISFAGNNQELIRNNWEIIALSREARHDYNGARAARENK